MEFSVLIKILGEPTEKVELNMSCCLSRAVARQAFQEKVLYFIIPISVAEENKNQI